MAAPNPAEETGGSPLRRAVLWVVGNLLVALLCVLYLLTSVEWFLGPALEPWIRTWPQAIAVLVVLLTPTTVLIGALLFGRVGRGRMDRRALLLLLVLGVVNLGVAASVVVDGSRPAPDIDHDVEVVVPDP